MSTAVTPIPRPYLYPDQSIDFALRVLRHHPVVPVVHRADPGRLVGMLALDDVLQLQTPE
jgi:CBS domain-containing protein